MRTVESHTEKANKNTSMLLSQVTCKLTQTGHRPKMKAKSIKCRKNIVKTSDFGLDKDFSTGHRGKKPTV